MLERLADLGFKTASVLSEDGAETLVKIRTSKGWTYERFTTLADIDRWAVRHEPEAS